MLQDELEPLSAMVHQLIMPDPADHAFQTTIDPVTVVEAIKTICDRMKATWQEAVFSELPDHSLKRYFDFHLEGIRELSDTLFEHVLSAGFPLTDDQVSSLVNEQLLFLISHLRRYYPVFFNAQVSAPLFWRERIFKNNVVLVGRFCRQLEAADIPVPLKYCVTHYLQEMSVAKRTGFCSFYALEYYAVFVQRLAATFATVAITASLLEEVLYVLNFNRLEFLVYYQAAVQEQMLKAADLPERLKILQGEKWDLHRGPLPESTACHADFEAIFIMREKWLEEQTSMIGREAMFLVTQACKFSREKILLNLSVAHIACLIRLLVDDDYLSTHVLQEIFQFVAEHFSSKRQDTISAGSLSKEYYSISQSTAARVQGVLQKLVAKVTQEFFR